MEFTKLAATVSTAAMVASLSTVASAATIYDDYTETDKINPVFPIVNTTHGSDHIKANILNPHPVCNTVGRLPHRFVPGSRYFPPGGHRVHHEQDRQGHPAAADDEQGSVHLP